MKKIAIIGFGNMGSAIYNQLAKNYSADLVYVCGRNKDKADELGVTNYLEDAQEVVDKSEIIILAIKPQSFYNWQDIPNMDGKLVISVMAGVSIDKLISVSRSKKIIRTMPNLAIQVNKGVTGWIVSDKVGEDDKDRVKKLLSLMGVEIEVSSEDQLDKLSAISGSGPAYFYYFCELMVNQAKEFGFTDEQAKDMVEQTFIGAAKVLENSDKDCAGLRQAVSSKGGTTLAALDEFEKADMTGILAKAVDRACKRAKELDSE